MRQLRRPGVLVPTLADNGTGGRKRTAHIEDFEQSGARPSAFPSHWTQPDVRGALYAMQGRVCAYCGADISEAGIDVEHFRPKSNVDGDSGHGGYWWLAYDFANYVLSCTVCNQKLKRNRFPLAGGAPRVCYADRHRLADEARTLLDPVCDPVEDWISVDWSKPACTLVASSELEPGLAARVEAVLEFFRVNLKPAQRKKRAEIQRLVIEKLAQDKADEVRSLAIRFRPHSLVAKRILAAKAPHALPTPDEELEWLLADLSSDLILKMEAINGPHASTLDRTEAEELLWALAVLWRDPPCGSPDLVAQFLDRRGLIDLVSEYLKLL